MTHDLLPGLLDVAATLVRAIPPPAPDVTPTPSQFDRQVASVARKLGVPTAEPLSQRVRELLAKGLYEMAVIEYRKVTGAGLEAAFYIVSNGGQLDVESILDRVLAELDRRFPAAVEA